MKVLLWIGPTTARWAFRIFFIFFGSGTGKGESEGTGSGGVDFLLKIPQGGGGGLQEGPRGREGVCGELGIFWGGGGELNIFFRGRNVHQERIGSKML